MVLFTALSKILPIIFLLIIGVLIKHYRFLSESTMIELKKLVLNVSLPSLLFFAFLNTNFQMQYFVIILIIFIVNIFMLVVGKGIQRALRIDNSYFPLMFSGFEMGMLGFSLYGSIYGVRNISYIGVLDIGQEIFVWFILSSILISLQKGSIHLKSTLFNFISSPVIIAIESGILLNILGLKEYLTTHAFTSSITITLSMLSQLTIPLILIIIGYQLSFHFSKMRLPLITILARTLILILLALVIDHFILRHLLNLSKEFSIALYTMFILPPPFIIPLYIVNKESSLGEYVGNTLSLGTIFTLLGFIVIVFLFSM